MAIAAAPMITGALILERADSQTPPAMDNVARAFGGTVILFQS